ncbi:MAG: SUMF1/EgtB/PvdO family nonheme iron enzyme, partial [Kiritimatiellae bacterium]|nr:SUMF1/EgtB/PvdO family nonheme iron enzyme [Kiritimatiellia bacterium]
LGWYGGNSLKYGNSNGTTYEVGLKKPNAWGLYDMHGDVFEMCLDWYSESDDYTDTFAAGWESGAPTVAPEGALSGMYRVARGGGYFYGPLHARSCYRRSFDPATASKHYGFRLAYVIGNE